MPGGAGDLFGTPTRRGLELAREHGWTAPEFPAGTPDSGSAPVDSGDTTPAVGAPQSSTDRPAAGAAERSGAQEKKEHGTTSEKES